MSDYSGSRNSTPPSSVHSSIGSSAATVTGAEPSDRLLRSECRRQGGKNCGHVECQVRASQSQRSAAEHQHLHDHEYEHHSGTPMSMSPALPTAVAYRRSTRLDAHLSARTTTTTTTTTTTRRVVRSSLLDSAPSSSGGFASSALSGRLKFSSNNSNKSEEADEDDDDEEAIEKGALEAHLSMKENFGVDDFDEEIFGQQFRGGLEENVAGGGGFGGIVIATKTLMSRTFYKILWAIASVCSFAKSGFLRSVAMATFVLLSCFHYVSLVGTKFLYYFCGGLTFVVVTTVGGVRKTSQLLARVIHSASVILGTLNTAQLSFMKAVTLITYGALSSVAQAAYLPVTAVRAVAMATLRQASNGFRSVSQLFIVANNNERRHKRSCLCLLLLILLPLLLLLAAWLGYAYLPSNRVAQLASSGKALRAAGSTFAISASSAGTSGVSAVSWLLLWLGNATATASNAAIQSVSTWSSIKSPSTPTIAPSSAAASCCRADLSALEMQVAALRTAMASLEQKSHRNPEPLPPTPPPPPSPPAASVEALAMTDKHLANLSARQDSLEQRFVKFSLEIQKAGDAATAAAVAAAADAVARSSANSSNTLFEISQRVTLLSSRLEAEAERQRLQTDEAVAAVADKEAKTVAEIQARLVHLELSIASLSAQWKSSSTMTSSTAAKTSEIVLADQMPDFALHSAGGYAVSTRCTSAYTAKSSYFHLLGLPVFSYINGPNVALQPGLQLGECWPFVGFPGHLVVKLAVRARISHVTVDHVPRSQTYNGTVASAPRQFSVYGLNSERDEFAQAKLLGSFVYNADNGTSSQTFELTHNENTATAYPCVELVILSNHGAEHTCLYRFRVHGSLV